MRSCWPAGSRATGASRTGCTTSATSPRVKTPRASAPAPDRRGGPCCAAPRSTSIASTDTPTSPAPNAEPAGAPEAPTPASPRHDHRSSGQVKALIPDFASPLGVARQYSGTLGKVGNCQVAVSICAVTDGASCPLNWRLFLPAGWDDTAASTPQQAAVIRARRARAGLPAEARHREKWRLALDMLEELAGWGLTAPVVVGDAGYGDNAGFRDGLSARGWAWVVQVSGDLSAQAEDAAPQLKPSSGRGRRPLPRYRSTPVGLREHVLAAGRAAVAQLTWREGSRGSMSSHFLVRRVRPAGHHQADRRAADGSLPAVWLLAQWPPEAAEPTDYWLSSLPEDTPLT